MNNGLIFNGEGPMMSGTWYNPSNGDSFTVADSFFQDNQYIVKTTDGRMLDYNFIQHYVKSDKPIPKQEKPKIDTIPKEIQDMIEPANMHDAILQEDLNLINGSLGSLTKPTYTPVSTNNHIIEKALSKKSIPTLNVCIAWDQFPEKELEMLMDIMDIKSNEIVDWYLMKVDLNIIKGSIMESLKNYINGKLKNEPEDEEFIPYMCSESNMDNIDKQNTSVSATISGKPKKSKIGPKKAKK